MCAFTNAAREVGISISLTALSVLGVWTEPRQTLCLTLMVEKSPDRCSPSFNPRASPMRSPVPASSAKSTVGRDRTPLRKLGGVFLLVPYPIPRRESLRKRSISYLNLCFLVYLARFSLCSERVRASRDSECDSPHRRRESLPAREQGTLLECDSSSHRGTQTLSEKENQPLWSRTASTRNRNRRRNPSGPEVIDGFTEQPGCRGRNR
jgi:hypothetical protein